MADISKDAQGVLSGASEAARNYAISNAPGSVLTSGEAKRLLAQYNASPDAVMSAQNISATQNNPTPAPDDLLGIRKQLNTELGVDAAEQAYQDVYGRLSQYDSATEELTRQIGEQPLSMNVLRGEQATANEKRATERNALARQADVAQSALLAAKQEAAAQFDIRRGEVEQKRSLILQYPGAGITFSDSFESAAGKLDKYQEQAKKDAYKDTIKAKLLDLGLKTSGSTKELEKRLKKVNKSAYNDAKEESALKIQALKLDMENTMSLIAERGKNSENGGYGDSDIQAYIDAYGKGQITAPNIPTKIRDKVLAGAAPILKEQAKLQATSDINELMNPVDKSGNPTKAPNRDVVISKARALYPELGLDEVIGIVNDITNSGQQEEQGGIINWFKSIF